MDWDLIDRALTSSRTVVDILREQFANTVSQLQKREEATEVLVGFTPDFKPEEREQLGLASAASSHQRTATLHHVQGRVEALATSFLENILPSKSEAHLPGVTLVEQDRERLTKEGPDSSWLTNSVRMMATPSMIGKLARSKQVAFVIPNFEVRLPRPVEVTEADLKPVQEKQKTQKMTWGLDYLKIPKLWDKGLKGKDVLIGHLDTGVDATHPDLKGRIKDFAVFDPRGQLCKSDPFDSGTHGTHTAGTIAGGDASGISIGVAPEAKLVSALVLLRGSGTVYQIIKGIEWALSQRVRILNLSLGGAGYSSIYEYALARVVAAGVLPVCSIGNEGPAVTGSPGNIVSACGVGAIDSDREPASFSGGGSISWYNPLGQLIEVHKPDVVAPGVAVYSSLPQGRWGESNGTSMAAPHVAGIAALLIEAKPTAPLDALINAIYTTAKHPTATSDRRDSRFGRGVIDPVAALERLTA
jgi:subtilisin family serine protease